MDCRQKLELSVKQIEICHRSLNEKENNDKMVIIMMMIIIIFNGVTLIKI